MGKKYNKQNVYNATLDRIKYLFDNYDNVVVAFSGGKDSSACLWICYDYAKKNNLLHKLAMYHLDYEAQYQMTTDFVEQTFCSLSNIRKYWLCLPVKAQCSCSMQGGVWTPWSKDCELLWVRKMPTYDYVINEGNCEFPFSELDYKVQQNFSNWYTKKYGKTAFVIGIRADESLGRYRAITNDSKEQSWICGFNAYPIYDWTTEDVWIYHGKYNKPYNHLYDLYYYAGLELSSMRVASPFNSYHKSLLRLYKVIDPNNWGKMVNRVNGVNFYSMYGSTSVLGYRNITKPNHFSWQEYCNFLLNTLDDNIREHYIERFNKYISTWSNKGKMIDDKTLQGLYDDNIPFSLVSKKKNKNVVKIDHFIEDVTKTDYKKIPTYKLLCLCIIKNDYHLFSLGFEPLRVKIRKGDGECT